MRCLIYLRVSTDEQADKGLSIPAQREACLKFAELKQWEINPEKDIYVDAGESARSANRPALQEMLSRCKKDKNVDIIIVHKIDRLARNVGDHAAIRTILKKHDVQLVSVVEPVDDSPTGHLLENIMASVAEFYSANLGQEVKKDMTQAFKKGRWPTVAPLGYINKKETDSDGTITKKILVDPVRGPMIQKVFRLFATTKFTKNAIANELKRMGFKTRTGKYLTPTNVAHMLKNKFYMGFMEWGGQEMMGTHEPLVSPVLFYRVQDVLALRSRNTSKNVKYRFSLRGVLTCSRCGRRFVAETHKKGKFSYYRCSSSSRYGLSCDQKMIPEKIIEDQVLTLFKSMQLPAEILSLAKLQMQQMEDNRTQGVFNERKAIREKIARLEEKQQKLLDDRLEGLIDKDLCYNKLSQIQRDLDLANIRLKEIQEDNNANLLALNKTVEVLGNLYKLYKVSDAATRLMYHKAFFKDLVVNDKQIVDIKWNDPFGSLYQSNPQSVLQTSGEPGEIRTLDPLLKRQLLYQLSYGPKIIYLVDPI
jgi:site-specific DNA recombinase